MLHTVEYSVNRYGEFQLMQYIDDHSVDTFGLVFQEEMNSFAAVGFHHQHEDVNSSSLQFQFLEK